jgi:hypothetical protein
MLNTINEYQAISRSPKGRLIWICAIEKIDKMVREEATEYFANGLRSLTQDLTQRDLRDFDVNGRRLHESDIKEPMQDAYFHLIEAIGCLEACTSEDNHRRNILFQSAALLAAQIREEFSGIES